MSLFTPPKSRVATFPGPGAAQHLLGNQSMMVPELPGESLGLQRPLGSHALGMVLLWESGDLLAEALEDPGQPSVTEEAGLPRPCSGARGEGQVLRARTSASRQAAGLSEADSGPGPLSLLLYSGPCTRANESAPPPMPIANQQSRANGPKAVEAPELWGALNKEPLCPQSQEKCSDPWGGRG